MSFIFSGVTVADDIKKPKAAKSQSYNSWTFAGRASNEADEPYYYYFQMQQHAGLTSVQAVLLRESDQSLMYYYQQKETTADDSRNDFYIGKAFLHFNPISSSWIFGVKAVKGQSFNFRVELLQQADTVKDTMQLAEGIDVVKRSLKRMNGHVRLEKGKNEEFVTADQNWYRHVVRQDTDHSDSVAEGVFCFFNNQSRLFALAMPLARAKSASETELLDATGKSVQVSQFLQMRTLEDGDIRLSLTVPAMRLRLSDLLAENNPRLQLKAGFVKSKDKRTGFCFMDTIGLTPRTESVLPIVPSQD